MASESERKRFHLEKIIKHISEESSTVNSASFHPTLVANDIPAQVQKFHLLTKRDSNVHCDNDQMSDDTNDDESGKEERADADESSLPTKISPRCDICGLLHFKSYRCVSRFSAPEYLRRAFDETTEKIRVCRKCLTSKENCVENVAISNLAQYSAQIRQMKIPLGITSERRTRAFEFVVRDLKNDQYPLLDGGPRLQESENLQPARKTMLQKFSIDDPIQKNLFLKELNLFSTDMARSVSPSSDMDMQDVYDETSEGSITSQYDQFPDEMPAKHVKPESFHRKNKAVYHVAAKDVASTHVTEKKLGEMFDARKGVNHDLVMHTKRAWKPNKKYNDLHKKVERNAIKKAKHRKQGKLPSGKTKPEKSEKSDEERIRTCGINCAVCLNHVQKSYSCCTFQTAPEKYKHLFTPGVIRLKICRKCIPYKKVAKVDETPTVVKKKLKMKQKRGRKAKSEKPGPIVKGVSTKVDRYNNAVRPSELPRGPVMTGNRRFSAEPLAPSIGRQEMVTHDDELTMADMQPRMGETFRSHLHQPMEQEVL